MTPAQLLILTLARACIGEAGWDSAETGECAAITYVHLGIARTKNADPMRTTIQYSSALKTSRHPWIRGLMLDERRPKSFPKNLKWKTVHLPRWEKTVAVVRKVLSGELKNPCEEATIYGSRQDWEIKTWRGFEQVCVGEGWGNLFGRKKETK